MHEEVEILLPLATVHVVDGAGRTERLEPGDIGIFNSGSLHGARPPGSQPWSARVLLVATETMAGVWEELSGQPQRRAPWFPSRIVADRQLATELHAIFEKLRRPLASSECQSRLRSCLARLIQQHAGTPPQPPASPRNRLAALRVRDYLRNNIVEPVSTDELARVAGLSKFYLLRAFAREYGLSPHTYQMELRLARARTLLARGASASLAAYHAGFADQSHLTRRMKAAFGFTPAAYARQFAVSAPAFRGFGDDAIAAEVASAA